MLSAQPVVGAHDAPLEQAPRGLRRVGGNVALDPLAIAVVDGGVNGVVIAPPAVALILVRVDRLGLVLEGAECRSHSAGSEARMPLPLSQMRNDWPRAVVTRTRGYW